MIVGFNRICIVISMIGLSIYLVLGCNTEVTRRDQLKTKNNGLISVYIIQNGVDTCRDKVDFKKNTLTAMGPYLSDQPKKIGMINVKLNKSEISDIFNEVNKGHFHKFKIKLAWLKETPYHMDGDAWMAFVYGNKKYCFLLPTQEMMKNIPKSKIVSYKKMYRIYDKITYLIYHYKKSGKVKYVSIDDKRWKKAEKEGDNLIDLSYTIK